MTRPARRAAPAALTLACLTLAVPLARAQRTPPRDAIRLNQVGFYPAARKVAVVADTAAARWAVLDARGGDTVLAGELGPAARWEPSGEAVRVADFSALARPGRYLLAGPGVGRSHPFVVDSAALREVARGAIRAFYFQRASTALPPRFAGRWSRPAGHPDTAVLVHPSAADARRPAGSRVAAPGGWYDAGDYNKYVVNSGISTYTLLLVAEHFPRWAASTRTGIPESGGAVPDVLDEALWNLRWMLAMQDPADGGVYHKLTSADFDAMEMPHADTLPRWVVQKSTAAALDLAATAAHASLLARRLPRALPGLADSLLRAATAAWGWARAHPDSVYDQRRLNARHAPAINTGAYGDTALADERRWAAAEL